MHIEIYKIRPGINSIIHAHPPYTTATAVSGVTVLPAIIAEAIENLGILYTAEYEPPSSQILADTVAKYFETNDAVLMANHGAVVCGNDLKKTFYKMETLEFYSQVYLYSGILGKRSELSAESVQALMNLRH